jgi:hypothetical protein
MAEASKEKEREQTSHRESRKTTTGEEIYMLFFGLRIVPGVGYGRIRGLFAVWPV